MDQTVDTKIKKISLKNYQIQKNLSELLKELSDEKNKKKLSKSITEIRNNDRELLKSFDIKFSEKDKNKILPFLNY